MTQVSLFESAHDNQPTTQSATWQELFADLHNPIVENEYPDTGPNTAEFKAFKEAGPCWSAATFSGTRSAKNLVSVSYLVYDIDGPGKQGLHAEQLDTLLEFLEESGVAWAVHSTITSGFVAPNHKLRVILPLSAPVDASTYARLWAEWTNKIPVAVDEACKKPERVNFTPRVLDKHVEHYLWKSGGAKPIAVGKSAFAGAVKDVDWNRVGRGYDVLEDLKTTDEKANTAHKAGRFLGRDARRHDEKADQEKVFSEIWPKIEASLKQNPIAVADWAKAQQQVRNGIAKGFNDILTGEDPLKSLPRPQTSAGTNTALAKRALREFEKAQKEVKKNPSALSMYAKDLGKYAEYLDEAAVSRALIQSVYKGGFVESAPELENRIAVAYASGKTEPAGGSKWMEGLIFDKAGDGYVGNDENVSYVLEFHPECVDLFKFDVRKQVVVATRETPWGAPAGPIDPNKGMIAVMRWVRNVLHCTSAGLNRTSSMFSGLPIPEYDFFLEWLEELEWDGVHRLDTWLADYAGAQNMPEEYLAAVGKRWLIGAVARTFEPGCKMDTVLVLAGEQGIGKSTLLANLVPKASLFTDNLPDIEDKDVAAQLSSHTIVEIAELAGVGKKEQDKVKQFITEQVRKARLAYERAPKEYPRRCVLAGTTNEIDGYLNDSTGARRYWPVECGQCEPFELVKVRDQLWAEAVVLYKNGTQWHLTRDEEKQAVLEQKNAQAPDVNEEAVHNFWSANKGGFSTLAFITHMQWDTTPKQQRYVAHLLRGSGFHQERKRTVGGRGRKWVK